MVSKSKAITIAITTVALSLGSVGIATASNSKSLSESKTTITSTAVKSSSGVFAAPGVGAPGAELASVLSALVTKGTITQAQSDAITAAIAAARTAEQSQEDANRGAMEALVAKTIGIDAATIKTRLMAGESLATIAGAKKDALIAALVAEATKRIDAAVTSGKMTAAQATTQKAGLLANVTDDVNAPGGRGLGKGGGRGHGDKDGDKDGKGKGPRGKGAPGSGTPTAAPSLHS